MQRESFKSRLGFLLVSAGCAIGIGNVWRFPYVALLPDLSGNHGTTCFDNGIRSRTCEPQECGAWIQGTRKARQQMAYPRLVCHGWMLSADDVLHNRIRLDAFLFL